MFSHLIGKFNHKYHISNKILQALQSQSNEKKWQKLIIWKLLGKIISLENFKIDFEFKNRVCKCTNIFSREMLETVDGFV